MEPTEMDKPKIETRAFSDESGATPLSMDSTVAQIPRMIDPMASHHENSSFKAWSLTELLSQKRLVATIPISESHTDGTLLWRWRHTFQEISAIFFGNDIAKLFSLSSWKVHFRMEFRSNFQQVGQVLVTQTHIPRSLWPMIAGVSENSIYGNYFYMTMLPHVKVPLGEDTDVEVVMDWNCPMGAIPATSDAYRYQSDQVSNAFLPVEYDMGTVYVTIGQKMQIAEKVNPNAYVRIWAYLTDLRYAAYTPSSQIL